MVMLVAVAGQVYSAGVGLTGDFSLTGVFGRTKISAETGPLHEVGNLPYGNVPGQSFHP